MAAYWDAFRQSFFIPAPTLTEANLPDQSGRVFIVTGGYAGVGKELCKILYAHNGTIYIAGRSQDKYNSAVEEVKSMHTSSTGRLEFMQLDLSNLSTIKPAVESFLSKEQKLHVLTNNAGLMRPALGSTDSHGHELQMGTNCLGPYLLTQLLTPTLIKTAASSPAGSVRVTWAASLGTMFSPKNGVAVDESKQKFQPKVHTNTGFDYTQSKAANVFLSREYQKQVLDHGIISNSWNPGNLLSELQRHLSWLEATILKMGLYPPKFGAYTELWAGWSKEAGEKPGAYIGPWGRFVLLRSDVDESPVQGDFVKWCEEEVVDFR